MLVYASADNISFEYMTLLGVLAVVLAGVLGFFVKKRIFYMTLILFLFLGAWAVSPLIDCSDSGCLGIIFIVMFYWSSSIVVNLIGGAIGRAVRKREIPSEKMQIDSEKRVDYGAEPMAQEQHHRSGNKNIWKIMEVLVILLTVFILWKVVSGFLFAPSGF